MCLWVHYQISAGRLPTSGRRKLFEKWYKRDRNELHWKSNLHISLDGFRVAFCGSCDSPFNTHTHTLGKSYNLKPEKLISTFLKRIIPRIQNGSFSFGRRVVWARWKVQHFCRPLSKRRRHIWKFHTRPRRQIATGNRVDWTAVRVAFHKALVTLHLMCELSTHLRCDKNFPVEWPEPSQPGIGHLEKRIIRDFPLEF